MDDGSNEYFGPIDFVVFGGSLLACALVGVYFAVKDRKKADTVNYYFGGKHMSPVAVGISLAVSYISALTIIGGPTETYLYGTVVLWYMITYLAGTAIAMMYYIPMLHRLQVKTVFEYLELRFSPSFRKMMSAIELVSSFIYMCFALLVPSLALSAVTPIGLHWSIVLTSAVCTLYTTVGGIKAVVWTDVVQFGFMFFGSAAALTMATIEVGGIGNIWNALDRGGRLNFFDFNPDPTLRSTFWTTFVGGSISESPTICLKQAGFQRYLSCRTVHDAQMAAFTTIFPKFVLASTAYLSGVVAYAYFEGCDPLASGAVTKSDQMFPYLVLKVFRNLPGMAGLFVAAAFSGSLSTVSSGLNSMSAQLLEDFLLPLRPNLSRRYRNAFSKLAAFGLGLAITGVGFLLLTIEGTVISVFNSARNGFTGACLGVYTLALFFPWCNTKGAVAGEIMGVAMATWIGIGGIVYGKSPESQRKLPVSTHCCNVTKSECLAGNLSSLDLGFVEATGLNSSLPHKEYNPLYAVSFWYLAGIGLFVTVTVGLLVSFITGPNDPAKSDPRLFCPFVDNRRLPEKVRRFFRFGVPDVEKETFGSVCKEDENCALQLKPRQERNEQTAGCASSVLGSGAEN